MSKFQKLFAILGVLFMVLGIATVFFWESYGREMYFYKTVAVLNEDVEADTKIQKNMIAYLKIEQDKLITDSILYEDDDSVNAIVGKVAKHFIPKNAQLSLKFFEDEELYLKDNQYIAKIPSDWLFAIPSSIRRKDKAYFYAVKDIKKLDENIAFNRVTSDTHNNEDIITTFDPDNANIIKEKLSSSPIICTTVAYVKDSANREVVNVGDYERYDGSSQISSIEVIVDFEQMKILEDYIVNGNKFIILYN